MATLTHLFNAAISLAAKVLQTSGNSNPSDKMLAPKLLNQHLRHIAKWSSSIVFLGSGRQIDVDAESIALDYSLAARQFRPKDNHGQIKSETDLLRLNGSYLLIGDPGSGKTTTLKRIARKLFLEEGVTHDRHQFPILIRFKEISELDSISTLIASAVGFYVEREERTRRIVRKVARLDEKGNAILNNAGKQSYAKVEEEETYLVSAIGGKDVDAFIAQFLNERSAVVLLDGLDELDTRLMDVAIDSLNILVESLTSGKIIVTCRAGQFNELKKCKGFELMSILPLTNSQVRALARCWLEDSEQFMKELYALPYRDLADRPLLLSQLLLVYRRFGDLPKQPKDVYHHIIELLLKEWDSEQGVTRQSAYSDFNVRKKADFLAELSFHLMYTDRKLEFSTDDLTRIYKLIHSKFDLPLDESKEVAEEIETHTGIVVSAGYARYEFSHLSIHEYLCADYIVRCPFTLEIRQILATHPEPVAIAIALASNPTAWFISLVMNEEIRNVLTGNSLHPFLSRLIIERPGFSVSEDLGFSILNLFYSTFSTGGTEHRLLLGKLFQLRGILESVRSLLENRNAVKIVREKPGSRKVIITYTLPLNPVTGKAYTKEMWTNVDDLKVFFTAFGLTLKPSHITPSTK